ncbi:hypothetical protein HFP57_15445 [Parasphingopyxis algicola]|uniref:hypothetical protein n=1 Tax=Parasphingopyxis algicola TaxID=2026624 RepID=UPI0015A13912|nr:hypothetical protein [Parasphingopyxis algicola]QLC26286.1 hypothetical protein HFP57_15445 [Parasphingopyxis algicola]
MTITRKFRSVAWAATVATAALSCYLISHRVAAERNALEEVERDIQQAREDILSLNTEFQTRSRMSQIELWNRRDFALTAPEAGQFLEGELALASLLETPPIEAPIRQASATEEPNDDQIDTDIFEAPDDGDIPQIQQAAYLVPEGIADRARGERIAFLDDQLRGAIAGEAEREKAEEDDTDR